MTRVHITFGVADKKPMYKEPSDYAPKPIPVDVLNDRREFSKGATIHHKVLKVEGILLEDVPPEKHYLWVGTSTAIRCWTKFECEEVPHGGHSV
jgi:hypothetical protein